MPAFLLPIASDLADRTAQGTEGLDQIHLKSYRHIELAATRTAGNLESVPIDDQDVVALELEGGFKLWMSGEQLRAEVGRPPSRGAIEWQLADGLAMEDTERGVGTWVIKALEVFGLDPIGIGVDALASRIERNNGNLIQQRDATAATGWRPLDGGIPAPEGEAPVLLFIHGTFSSATGGFGGLFEDRRRVLELTERYGEHIYSYEHRTLTEDPVDNVLALVSLLPDGVSLDLVSHSRGGLVGDVLAFAARGGAERPFGARELEQIGPDDAAHASIRGKLEQLGDLIEQKKLRVRRFVRVASPSRGTTLASGRLDRWLSILANLAGFGAKGVPGLQLAEGFMDLLVAVAQKATRPEELPGLAAMGPGSPLIRLLNGSGERVPGALYAVAGDIQGDGLWSRAKLLIPDLFFAGDHDLVVNTGSMYGGPSYETRLHLFDRGPSATHFNYFVNPTSAPQVVAALTAPRTPPVFTPITAELAAEPVRGAREREGAERRPVLFLLPGIMGSGLAVDGRPVWLDVKAIAGGGIADLAVDSGRRVTPEGPLARAYAQILSFFRNTHDIVPFGYDWRLSVQQTAALLAEAVEDKLEQAERHRQPVRLLAHSMGGLVARAMIAEHPRLWERIRALGGRLVMLGTPNGGSWEIVRLLTARATTLKKLALVDRRHRQSELLRVIGEFPGVLDLLPEDDRDFFRTDVWNALKADDQARGSGWHIPGRGRSGLGRTRLEEAGRMRRRLRESAPGPEGMLYVAGQARSTACGVRIADQDQHFLERTERTLEFLGSRLGDGSVLWEDGPLPNMATWYMTGVEHGDLANTPAYFEAIRSLLAEGATTALPRRPPVSRSADTPMPLPEREPAYYPDEDSLLASALGMGPPRAPETAGPPVAVSVVHGNLAFARHAVAVGHYAGGTIIAAEAYLDRVLGGRLGASLDLDIYPGALGTYRFFANPHPEGMPRGALVVGLGAVGELTPSALTDSFARALLGYAREVLERDPMQPRAGGADEPAGLEVRLSSLLIGTGAGGFAVRDSVGALLRGVSRANAALARSAPSRHVRIGELEIIEIREDMAMEAARALGGANRDPELAGQFAFRTTLFRGHGGHRAGDDGTDPAWWHRLQVLCDRDGGMHFTFLTQRARAEQTLLATQRALVDDFVADAIRDTRDGPETSRTLFEMLLPNSLKDGRALRSNLVLMVDESSARFPWELLQDRWSTEAKPPAVERGMLRQLQTSRFRADPKLTLRGRALVIGEPKSGMAALPGARAEAERVHETLESRGFQVRLVVDAQAGAILRGLHADAYQVLHLAGHGVHRQNLGAAAHPRLCRTCNQALPTGEDDLLSGMVIGPGQVLTASDVEQMRQVPELVFINCCHLARTDIPADAAPAATDLNQLAANLAVAFIRMGVRAVIAAGWAVDDSAALTFATAFYREMSAGERFGAAVRLAREETWRAHPGVNTWGAYQCYGDPDYRLRGTGGNQRTDEAPACYVAAAEAVADLANLAADALVANTKEIQDLRERLAWIDRRLEQTRRDCGEDWGQTGEVLAARGLACAELGLYEEAVQDLDTAMASDAPGISRDLIEHRTRCQSRVLFALHEAGDSAAALGQFDDLLAALGAGRDPTPSLARVYTLSGIYWRRIQVLERTERKTALEAILKLYDDAVAARSEDAADPLGSFTRLLWLSARYLLSAYSKREVEEVCPDFDAWCDRIKEGARADDRGGLRADVTRIEVDLLHLIRHRERLHAEAEAQGSVEDPVEAAQQALGERLAATLARGLSARQWSGLDNHLRLLETLLAGATVKSAERAKGAAIAAALVQRLNQG
ncbi:DUF7379 domain-containing protein [Thiocapsa rosea]|uniref:CHAT domain-containing protein n=1 Tax=Thiocapsa rosea TaxID=69360 RepID=A0A495VBA0_9GAMM|nr:CHAT domain-containing protein [Thiocapsa rosea]RKT46632.1 CHAT domain-containing protein [Thiocapsa rosea]